MMIRRLALFFAMLCGVAATQAPEFIQQYRQRLGGAIDELNAVVMRFDADAVQQGLSEESGIARLRDNTDPFVQGRGVQMQDIVVRFRRLTRQSEALASTTMLGQVARLSTDFDPRVLARAYQSYQPAVPVTVDGFWTGLAGFLIGGLLTWLVALPVRHLHRLRHGKRPREPMLGSHGLAGRSR